MNGIDKIISRIAEEARLESESVLSEARAKCDEIEAAAKKAEQDEYWKIVRAGTKEAESRLERIESGVALEVRKQELSLKQELVQAAFGKAADMLSQLPADEYTDFLSRLAAKASGDGSETVIFNEKDAETVGEAVVNKANEILKAEGKNAALTLSSETRSIKGGFILSAGAVETNCSADALVSGYKDKLSVQVASVLFGDMA